MTERKTSVDANILDRDVVVVGAGFAGLYMLHKVRQIGLSAILFEAGSGVGGTWFWNRYPGARCDVHSLEYSFSFSDELQQEWTWSEKYSAQPEILAYLNHVADRFDLRRDIRLETRVVSAHYSEDERRWTVTTDRGDVVRARYCIMATGCLSEARAPDIPGLETFKGAVYHTGRWPHEPINFSGKRVGVIGTGASGIQIVPMLAEAAEKVYVFQRTPNFSIPARNGPMDPAEERDWKAVYGAKRRQARETSAGILYDYNTISALSVSEQQRRADYEARWRKGGVNFVRTYADLSLDKAANDTAADFVREKIRQTVRKPEVAEKLTPFDHPIGAKRICIDTRYFEAYNRDNVTLVDIRSAPIEAATPEGLKTRDALYELDCLVFATGFDAVTGALGRIDIRGRGHRSLKEKWSAGPRSYLGLMSAGFPNLFTITGPGSPSILTNVVVSIEQHVEFIADAIADLEAKGLVEMEAEEAAENAWVEHVAEVAQRTLLVTANSWYMGANIPGKPRVILPYAGGFNVYRQKCDEVAARGYVGFRLIAGASSNDPVQAAAQRAPAHADNA